MSAERERADRDDVADALAAASAEAKAQRWDGVLVIGFRPGDAGGFIVSIAATDNKAELAKSLGELLKAVDQKTAGGLPATVSVEPPTSQGDA